jgi:diguanylate cyclase (GGDEF)-like protein
MAGGQTTLHQGAPAIRILFVEDVEADAELSLFRLKQAGLTCIGQRVETEAALREALRTQPPDLILSDFSLPQFDGLSALAVARELAPEVPFIFVSGAMGEERAVSALLCGAVDYILKSSPTRLAAAVRRALADAQSRAERRTEQARLARLERVLRMLSGVNGAMVRVRERARLLEETVRLAVSVGGYAAALVFLRSRTSRELQVTAASALKSDLADRLRDALLVKAPEGASLVEEVEAGHREWVCNDVETLNLQGGLRALLAGAALRSLVILPVVVDDAQGGLLVLAAHDAGVVSEEELKMLREVAGNLAFALQYLHAEVKVRFLSSYDAHTGLAKRTLFCEQLAALLKQPAAGRTPYAVVIFDIARLSAINDSYGRRAGDLLLQQVASRLKARLPRYERLGHFSGGTFAAIVEAGDGSLEGAATAVRKHSAALFERHFVVEGRQIAVGVRSGLAAYPLHGRQAESLVQNAEAALRRARASGERQTQYDQREQTQLRESLELERRLRLAVEREEFQLYYQPKVNIITRRVEGAEALIRWLEPGGAIVAPKVFLPLLESTGLIAEVGEWVVRRAILDSQRWLQRGIALRVAVNVSLTQLRLPDFTQSFLTALTRCPAAFAGLDVEVTEAGLHEELAPEIERLNTLRNAGVRVAIDDFGTGYSSLSRLAKLPVDVLKIDQSFVGGVPQDPAAKALIKTIVTLARTFRMGTVAEGVETQEQLDFLWQLGCEQSQGYLHSRPLPSDEFVALLQSGNGKFLRPVEIPPADDAQPGSASLASS